MRKLFYIIIITAAFAGCSPNPAKPALINKADNLELADFDKFFKRFKSDSTYQVAHVKFPLKVAIGATEGGEDNVKYIDKGKWRRISFKEGKTDIYKKTKVGKTKVSLDYMVEDTGIFITFEFLYGDGKWQLTGFRDGSD